MQCWYQVTNKTGTGSGDSLPAESALEYIEGVNTALVGMYAQLRKANCIMVIAPFFMYGDVVAFPKPTATGTFNLSAKLHAANDADALGIWTAIYSAVTAANNIIQAIDKVNATPDEKAHADRRSLSGRLAILTCCVFT